MNERTERYRRTDSTRTSAAKVRARTRRAERRAKVAVRGTTTRKGSR